jgi:hypothetical protein
VPRRQPQEPQLSVTFAGGRQLPNSEAELSAYCKAKAEYNKKMAKYNEAIKAHQSRSHGLKQSHHGLSCGPASIRRRQSCSLNLEMLEINPEIHQKLPKKVEIVATKNLKIPTNFNVQKCY